MGYKNEKQMGCITRVRKPDGLSEIDCGYRIAPLRQKDKTFCKIVNILIRLFVTVHWPT